MQSIQNITCEDPMLYLNNALKGFRILAKELANCKKPFIVSLDGYPDIPMTSDINGNISAHVISNDALFLHSLIPEDVFTKAEKALNEILKKKDNA